MVGIGTTFPHCMQHQVANLVGSHRRRPPLALGAVVNGPNGSVDLFTGGLGGFQDGMVHCAVPARGGSTDRAASISTTSGPGRPTSRRST